MKPCANSIYGTIYEERPDLVKYIANPDDAKIYTIGSNRRILCKCPNCGREKTMIISKLTKRGFYCQTCSDGVSYPNKFVNNVLTQLGISFTTEETFDWSNKKQYDIYVEDKSLIIENNGLQHYIEATDFTTKSLEYEQSNDKFKHDIAIENGIKHYVILDCRKSKPEWIKQSIMNSELPDILNFTEDDINWDECDIFALKNFVISIWDEWNQNHDLDGLINKYKLKKRTVTDYILRGYELGKCDKSAMDVYLETCGEKRKDMYSKPIHCITDDVYFKTKFEAGDYYSDIFPSTGGLKLTTYINKNEPYKGKMFEYITKEEFNRVKSLAEQGENYKVVGDYYSLSKGEK